MSYSTLPLSMSVATVSATTSEPSNRRTMNPSIPEKEIGGDPIGTADKFFNEHLGIHKLLVVDKQSRLRGLFTLSDIERISEEARSPVKPSRDEHFRLICGAAVSATRTAAGELDGEQILEHTAELVERAGQNNRRR